MRLVINHRMSLQGVPIISEGTCQSSFVDKYEIAAHLSSARNDSLFVVASLDLSRRSNLDDGIGEELSGIAMLHSR